MNHFDNGQNFNSRKQRNTIIPHKERGVVAIIVALSMVVLVGFIGLALDTGKLFVTKTELQNSADACALAAARELTGANNKQLEFAVAAGIALGTSNNVMFQDEAVSVTGSDITFSDRLDGSYLTEDSVAKPLDMKYVRCTVDRTDIPNWFMQVLGIGDQDVGATAVATMAPSQNFSCPIPVGICSASIDEANPGTWLQGTTSPLGDSITGDFGWVSFGDQGKNALADVLMGQCDVTELPADGTEIGQSGFISALAKAWNSRFGIYFGEVKKPAAKGEDGTPDRTGYAYYPGLDGVPPIPDLNEPYKKFEDYRDVQAPGYVPYQGNDHPDILLTDPLLSPSGGDNPLSMSEHVVLGADNRRVGIVAVLESSEDGTCLDEPTLLNDPSRSSWACVFMLHPIVLGDGADRPMWIEYIGPADKDDGPCATNGIPAGPSGIGPKVPTLVQ